MILCRLALGLKALWTIGLIFVSIQFPIQPAFSDIPAPHSYNLEYMISNVQDYRDFNFFLTGVNGDGNVSIVPKNKIFKSDSSLNKFKLNAIRIEEFDERAFEKDKAVYIENHAIQSNSIFPSTANYVASISVLPDRILIFLKVDDISAGNFNISREKALYHYPDGYKEEILLRGAELPFPPHHYSRPEMPGGFESYLAALILIVSALILRR
jgi:hypothetical protein